MLRKTIFWIHLSCGVTAGLVVLMMSVTGVLLTYERQILAFAERAGSGAPRAGAAALPVDDLLAAVREHDPDFRASSVTIYSDASAPALVTAGRSGTYRVDRYTGNVAVQGSSRLRSFFGTIEGWHRWFNAGGDGRRIGRAVTGASNFVFLFLVLSGVYLWLPRAWKWAALRTRLFFNPRAKSGKARDFNWHHVFGIWAALPLAVIVATAVVFSYGWANDLVYRAFGEEPPARGRGGPPVAAAASIAPAGSLAAPALSLERLFGTVAGRFDGWSSIAISVPTEEAASVAFHVDLGNGGQPQHRYDVTLDARTGGLLETRGFSTQSAGRRARSLIRFLHTGEALGWIGQSVAGLASAAAVLMVWTGLALAYRRLIVPLLRR